MPKGVGYTGHPEYKGKVIRKPGGGGTRGGGDSFGTPAGSGTPRSHDHPSPNDSMKTMPAHPMGSGPKRMQGAKMNPPGENTMPMKKTQGVR